MMVRVYTSLVSLLGVFDEILGCRFVCDGVLLMYVVHIYIQKQEMAGEAKAARMYRDEIETLKVQVHKHLMGTLFSNYSCFLCMCLCFLIYLSLVFLAIDPHSFPCFLPLI